jgi:uncharacterized sulfatase
MIARRTLLGGAAASVIQAQTARPNILFAIADDQSWNATSAAGNRVVKTPHFDRVARMGALFSNAFTTSPGCAPSRAAILTGRYPWQLEEAGTHASFFPKKFAVYTDLLAAAGYFVGLTGKGAGPCNFKGAGWKHNPAGPAFDSKSAPGAERGISNNDYAANFGEFLKQRPKGAPFCFWYGGHEPHRVYDAGSGAKSGKRPADVDVPPFLPDSPEVRSDLLDYYEEIEHFDRHLGRMLKMIEDAGELANTLVVVTADNGMSFPHSKAQVTEYGIHMPLAICWPGKLRGGRTIDGIVSFIDFAPTFLDAAGVAIPPAVTGKSLLPMLLSNEPGAGRVYAQAGRERHSHARADNLGYPSRGLRSAEFLYVRNFKPERWPAGDPGKFYDIDNGPSKTFMMAHRGDPAVRPLFEAAFGKHPGEELFDIRRDPGCLNNLAGSRAHAAVRDRMRKDLEAALAAQGDPRVLGNGDIFESYPRHSAMREDLGGFAVQGQYNPAFQRK